MQVIISGTHGIGKSTLFEQLKKEDKENKFVFTSEVVRTLIEEKGISVNRSCDHKSQMFIFDEHYKQTLLYDNLISDRGAVDAFVYATQNYLDSAYTYEQHKEHERIFLDTIRYYDLHILILPTNKELVDDGVRDLDKKYQMEIHKMFLKIYKRYKIPYCEVSGTTKERVDAITRLVGLKYF